MLPAKSVFSFPLTIWPKPNFFFLFFRQLTGHDSIPAIQGVGFAARLCETKLKKKSKKNTLFKNGK